MYPNQKLMAVSSRPGASLTLVSAGLRERLFMALLVLCIIQFFGAWIYPRSSFGGVESMVVNRAGAVPFQYLLWGLISLGFLSFVARRGVAPFGAVLLPFMPFLLVGTVAAAFGYNPFGSVRLLILWLLMAISAVVIGYELTPERALSVLLKTLFVMLLLSVIWSVAMPEYGTLGFTEGNRWRGLFTGKNNFGWIGALGLVVALNLIDRRSFWFPAALAAVAVVCLFGSGSKGALVASIIAAGYGYLLTRLLRHVTAGLGITLVLVGIVSTVIFALLALPLILAALGKDMTLTGRTEIWSTYFQAMASTPWLGQGPGAFTGLSPITVVLANRLSNFGAIATPHSMFLGVFGDAGLFGVVSFLGLMMYLSLIAPANRPTRLWLLCATIGFLMLVDGMVETHEVYTQGPAWFLLVLTRAIALRAEAPAAAAGRRGTSALQHKVS